MCRSLFCQSHAPHAAGCPLQSGGRASIRLVHHFRRPPFMPFVSHIAPQGIELRLTDPVVFQQRFFHFRRLPGRRTQPVEDRVLLDPFGTPDAADTHAFGQQRQRFQDRLPCRLASIEHRAIRFREGPSTALAPVTLRAVLGFSEANDPRRLDLTVQLTCFVRAKLPHWSQLVRHLSLEQRSFSGSILPTISVRETTNVIYHCSNI